MDGVFSQRVATDAWRGEVTAWISDELAAVGRRVTGEVEQRRIRPWSTQLVVPTDRGTVWFKGNCPTLAFEPAMQRALASLEPAEVDEPLAVDDARGWMLTADRGATLGDIRNATLEDWQAVVRMAATLQRSVVGEGPTLCGAGLPDCSPSSVPARYRWLIEQLAGLPPDHPSHLTTAVRGELEAGRYIVEDAVEALVAARLPVTLQHGDLHPWNVFVVGSSMRLFDFGDSQWAHALEMLAVPYGYVTRRTTHPWPAVLTAYTQVWSDVIAPADLETLMTPAMVTHAVNRSFTWLGCILGAQPHELAEWGDSPLYYLRLALQPFPPTDPGSGP